MIFTPFKQQRDFLRSKARIRLAAAGKRGGKTEVGAIEAVIHAEKKIGYTPNEIDPYIGVIIAPTTDMLRRLSLKKFLGFAKPFSPQFHQTHFEITWPNGSVIYGVSADKPERLEGIKANFIWVDESFQVDEQIFLEAMARVADTRGRLWCTGSLGVQYTNPKAHWLYKRFKEKPVADSEIFEWTTADNPYFPHEEIDRLKNTLDPITFRQMFEISWDAQGTNLVYQDFSDANVGSFKYDPMLETYCVIDWGFTHKMACLYIQYNRATDMVYVIDEIVQSKMTLEMLWAKMQAKPYRINGYFADIAGNQEREQTGLSNIAWFKQAPRNIHFKYRGGPGTIAHGISLIRSYISNAKGQRRVFVDSSCVHLLDCLRNYSYPESDGQTTEMLPIKENDDAADALRYFFLNRLDFTRPDNSFAELNRWSLGK